MAKIKKPVIIADALYNCHLDNVSTMPQNYLTPGELYGKGMVVGIVSALMATGMEFDEALKEAWRLAPTKFVLACLPESWRADWIALTDKARIPGEFGRLDKSRV